MCTLLRAAGLEDDTYGEAKRFFELSDRQLHKIVCFCHFGTALSAGETARYIRAKHVDRGQGHLGPLARFIGLNRGSPALLDAKGRLPSGGRRAGWQRWTRD